MRALERHNGRVQIMGIVNRTPDSFFDGGQYLGAEAACARVAQLVREGADIIDVGAESTRPGAPPVGAREQIERLGDIVAVVQAAGAVASVDTTRVEVAEHAIGQGATMVNSVSLAPAGELGALCARHGATLVLTHCRGSMTDMAGFSQYHADGYHDVVAEVADEWLAAAARARAAGLAPDRLVCDPGLGFAKNAAQSLELCARLDELKERVGHRLLVGPSRKSYLAWAVAAELAIEAPAPAERLGATLAAVLDCAARGADIVRVHDVAPVVQALAYARAVAAGAEQHRRRPTVRARPETPAVGIGGRGA